MKFADSEFKRSLCWCAAAEQGTEGKEVCDVEYDHMMSLLLY